MLKKKHPKEIELPGVRLILGGPVNTVPSGDSVIVLRNGTAVGTYPVIRTEHP